MTVRNLSYYLYVFFINAQLPPLKVAALYLDKLVIPDPIGANWETIGANHRAHDAVDALAECRDPANDDTSERPSELKQRKGARLCTLTARSN
jgi:hypothetical protein